MPLHLRWIVGICALAFSAGAQAAVPFNSDFPIPNLEIGSDASTANVTATGGVTAKTLAARFGRILNIVDDFGADPAGAADSAPAFTAAFNKAVDAAIFIPCGAYLLSSVKHFVSSNTSNLSIIGAGRQCVTIKFPAASSISSEVFKFASATNAWVSGITLDLANVTATGVVGIISQNAVNGGSLVVRDSAIINGSALMFLINTANAARGFVIDSNILTLSSPIDSASNGAVLINGAGSANGYITNNTLTNASIEVNASYTTISGNTCNSWGLQGQCINTDADAVNSHDNIITNNIAHGNAGGGILACYELWSNRTLVANNFAFNCPGDGFDIGGQNDLVTGNIAWGTGASIGTSAGFVLRWGSASENGNGSFFSGNQAFDGGGGGMKYGFADQTYLGGGGCNASQVCSAVMGNNNFVGTLGAIQVRSAAVTYSGSGMTVHGGTATGTASAQIIASTVPAIIPATMIPGLTVTFVPAATNAGPVTLSVGTAQANYGDNYNAATKTTGAIAINKVSAGSLVPLAGGELISGIPATVTYANSVWALR